MKPFVIKARALTMADGWVTETAELMAILNPAEPHDRRKVQQVASHPHGELARNSL